jgi:hypothetical protein
MHKVTFFPTGNADTCFIELENGKKIVFDYANTRDETDSADKRIDLERAIRQGVGLKKEVSIFAISHLDKDHYKRSSEIFWLDHAQKYQGSDRIKIVTLWVPAAAILEEGITEEGKTLRAEARYRLRQGYGIRVFSRPDALDSWLSDQGIKPNDRRHLITDAGKLAPELSLAADGVEFFVHSPFAERCDDGSVVVRNDSALFMQVTFDVAGTRTRLVLSADCPYDLMEGIVDVTKKHGNEERLEWDINNIPHHCSYLSLGPDKGSSKTVPTDKVRWLYESQGGDRGILVSTSKVIPRDDSDDQPPHRQAAAYYEEVATALGGEFIVTMEHPNAIAPRPLVIEIGRFGAKVEKFTSAPSVAATASRPRAG